MDPNMYGSDLNNNKFKNFYFSFYLMTKKRYCKNLKCWTVFTKKSAVGSNLTNVEKLCNLTIGLPL